MTLSSSYQERFVDNQGVRIHYVDAHGDLSPDAIPVLYIPGGFLGAESFVPELPRFSKRRTLAMSQRGRYKSDAPESGYTFEHFRSDVAAVVDDAEISSLFLFAFSAGTPAALGYAIQNPEKVKGIVIGDFPALFRKLTPEWVEQYANLPEDIVRFHAVQASYRESHEVLLWDELQHITCPVLILRAGLEGGMLSPEDAARYEAHLPNAQVIMFENSSHRLWQPDADRYFQTILEFFDQIV